MMGLVQAVIFDFGGVLMRTGDPAGRREWEARLGLSAGMLEHAIHGSDLWVKTQSGLVSPNDYWAQTAATLGAAESDIPLLRHDYFRDDHLDPGLMSFIATLRQAGYKVGLLSNDALTLETKLRDELAIYDAFDAVVISAQIGVMKPDERAYLAMTQALGVTPTEAVFIDDNAANIDGASRAGLWAIRYEAGMDVQAALAPYLAKES